MYTCAAHACLVVRHPPCECRESNPGPLPEQVLLTTELSLQAPTIMIILMTTQINKYHLNKAMAY